MTTDVADRQALERIYIELARRSFKHFLRFVVTETVTGDERPAPDWPYVVEMAERLDSGNSIVLLKSRQLYQSWLLAAFALFTAQMKGGNVLEFSQGQDYSRELLRKSKFIYDRLPLELRMPLVTDNRDELSFRDAGRIMSFPSTVDAGRGFTGRLVLVDEAAFHPYAQENYRAYRPTAADGGQVVIVSTANGPFGFFYNQFMAAQAGTSGYEQVFYPWSVRPDRDEEWYRREEKAYEGFHEDFLRENPSTIEDAFTTMSGLVYKEFQPDVHVGVPPIPFERCRLRVAGVDWGGGDPSAVVVLGLSPDDHIYQYDEWAATGPITLDEIGGFIRRWRDRAPLMSVECDPSQGVAIRTLARQFAIPARPANNKRGEGLDVTRFLLQNNRLMIDPNCVRSIEEFYGYRWRESRDPNTKERYATTTPVDHHADLMDARRYALVRLLQFMRSGPTLSNVSGTPFRTKAV